MIKQKISSFGEYCNHLPQGFQRSGQPVPRVWFHEAQTLAPLSYRVLLHSCSPPHCPLEHLILLPGRGGRKIRQPWVCFCQGMNISVSCLLKTRSGLSSAQRVSRFSLPLISSWDKVNGDESPEVGQERHGSQGRRHREYVGEVRAVLPCKMCILTRSDRSGLFLILCLR